MDGKYYDEAYNEYNILYNIYPFDSGKQILIILKLL